MQRRNGKNSASISPSRLNGTDNSQTVSYDSEKQSRLNQKTFGLTNRIWIILFLFSFIVFLTRIILPPDAYSSLPRHGYYANHNLKPKNYLNSSDIDPHPFPFCPVFGPGDEIGSKHGGHALTKSRVHLGSGARVQRVIHKALSGLPVTISVLGGSVSACHGSGGDPISPKCYPARFFQWWNSVFPHPASELTNGAMRKTDSSYYGFCSQHHLPDVTDLVILEFDADDPNDREWIDHFELLVRSILIRPDQPAVIVLGHFAPQIQFDFGFHGPEVMHSVVAQFYDVPHISTKPMLYPSWITRPDSIQSYYADPVLANSNGHELLAEVLISYIESQVCSAWSVETGQAVEAVVPGLPSNDLPTDARGLFGGMKQKDSGDNIHNAHAQIPYGRINSRPSEARIEEVAPYCISANDLINPLPPSIFQGSGWQTHHPAPGSASQPVYAHYWYSTMPLSKLRIPLQVGGGDIGIYYLQEPLADVGGTGSAVECWVDDNHPGRKLFVNAADVGEATPRLFVIDRFVTRGSHFVECQLLGEEGHAVPAFRLLGVFSS